MSENGHKYKKDCKDGRHDRSHRSSRYSGCSRDTSCDPSSRLSSSNSSYNDDKTSKSRQVKNNSRSKRHRSSSGSSSSPDYKKIREVGQKRARIRTSPSKVRQQIYQEKNYTGNDAVHSPQNGSQISTKRIFSQTRLKETEKRSNLDCKVQFRDELMDHINSRYKAEKKYDEIRGQKCRKEGPGPDKLQNTCHSESECDSEEEIMFEWEHHKWELNQMFFRENDIIKRGSEEYKDFFKFLSKYQTLQKQKKLQKVVDNQAQKFKKQSSDSHNNDPTTTNISPTYGLPLKFHNRYLVNFATKGETVDSLIRRLPPAELEDKKKRLSRRRIKEFRNIILLYLNFNQKKNFEKIQKLRKSQKELPIAQYREEILNTVAQNSIVLVAGDTGCGKSTQVPQYLMAAGYQKIACTQPRRIACISLCKRVAHETLNEHGSQVGFQIRFERRTSEHTKIVFLTEGLLLRQVQSDSSLGSYDVIILDEIHERHLHTDFLLGVVKCLLMRRTNVKIILMSATINLDLFSKYFLGKAPIIQVPGRLYPIKLQYFPIPLLEQTTKSDKLNPAPYVRVLQLIDNKYPEDERGDVLMFLSGFSEINTVVEAAKLYAQQSRRWIILSLHSNLSVSDQEKVFDIPPEGIRKCIVSTNIAETSVTIDGVRFVVDSGKVKEMSYDATCKMQKLKEFWVSQASAQQRKGRAGRTGPGVCFRLYSEEQYNSFDSYSTPEIQRVPLDSLVLQMIAMGLPDIRLFPFIEPPSPESLEVSLTSLKSLAAVTGSEELTSTGKLLSQLPVDVTIGKMLLMGSLFHQAEATLSLAAAMSVQSVFTSRAERDPDCAAAVQELYSLQGDPFTLLSVYRGWLEEKCSGGGGGASSSSRRWCRARGLEEQRLYELTKLRHQFSHLLQESKLHQSASLGPGSCNTAAERSRRYGELQQLKALKKSMDQQSSRKVKMLKVDRDGAALSDEETESTMDRKHVDFAMKNDPKQLRQLLDHADIRSFKDVIMLKIILSSGLYPNVALADEHNTYKPNSEQLFHTPHKPFTALHPTSVFAKQPDVLQLSDADIVELPNFSARCPAATRQQVLVYVSLLETNKAFLMNSFRAPTAQTLLLFANAIDTNADLTTLVFDSFIELRFLEPHISQDLVIKAVQLREQWNKLLELKLKLSQEDASALEIHMTAGKVEKVLSQGLIEFYLEEPLHSQRRLLAADVKVLHKGPGLEDAVLDPNPFTGEPLSTNNETGGMVLTEYLTYNSLLDTQCAITTLTETETLCAECQEVLSCRTLDRMNHVVHCAGGAKKSALKSCGDDDERSNPNAKKFQCDICRETFWLTIKEIFAHKKSHSS